MEPEDLNDTDLLAQLSDAQTHVAGDADPDQRRDAWHRVTTLLRELERRHPPTVGAQR